MIKENKTTLPQFVKIKEIASDGQAGLSLVKNPLDNQVYIERVLDHADLNACRQLLKSDHINLSKLYHVIPGASNSVVFIEEIIQGKTLGQVLERDELNEDLILDILLQLCDALAYLHSFKPPIDYNGLTLENIVVTGDDNTIKLMDYSKVAIEEDMSVDVAMLGRFIGLIPSSVVGKYASIAPKCGYSLRTIDQVRKEIINVASNSKKKRIGIITIAFTIFLLARRLLK